MIIRTAFFTEKGEHTAHCLFEEWEGFMPRYREGKLDDWVRDSFQKHLPVLFVGACGIAVRHIAPYVSDKMTDSPVLVMDEAGQYVIPVLSGHLGGANRLARQIAEKTGAIPVITTATDVNGLFAVDVFASENGFAVANREGIRAVSSKILSGGLLSFCIDPSVYLDVPLPEEFRQVPWPLKQEADVLICETEHLLSGGGQVKQPDAGQSENRHLFPVSSASGYPAKLLLTPRKLVIGMGCRRGKSFEELLAFFRKTVESLGKDPDDLKKDLYAIASIDIKKDEEGLQMLAQYYHVPFLCFPAKQLESMEGDFSESSFVKEKVGVANVCERAALCAAGEGGRLILHKRAENGMTAAAALRPGRIQNWRTSI